MKKYNALFGFLITVLLIINVNTVLASYCPWEQQNPQICPHGMSYSLWGESCNSDSDCPSGSSCLFNGCANGQCGNQQCRTGNSDSNSNENVITNSEKNNLKISGSLSILEAPLIHSGNTVNEHLTSSFSNEQRFYKINIEGPSRIIFNANNLDGPGGSRLRIRVLDSEKNSLIQLIGNEYTLKDSYETRTGGDFYIEASTPSTSGITFSLEIEYICIENAISNDGLKKCENSEWIVLTNESITGSKNIHEARVINSGDTVNEHLTSSSSNEQRFYKINTEGPSRIMFNANNLDGPRGSRLRIRVLDSEKNSLIQFIGNEYTLKDSYETRTGGDFYIEASTPSTSGITFSLEIEYICIEGNFSDDSSKQCKEGQWVILNGENLTENKSSDNIINKESITEEEPLTDSTDCLGCLVNDTCYAVAHIKAKQYCSYSKEFLDQKVGGEVCENYFECQSGICLDGSCVDSGLIRRILDWLTRFFGSN